MEPYAASSYKPRPAAAAAAPPPLSSYGIVRGVAKPREYTLDPIPLEPRPQPPAVPVRRGRQMRTFAPIASEQAAATPPSVIPESVSAPIAPVEPEPELVTVSRFGKPRARSRSRGPKPAAAAAPASPKIDKPAEKPVGILKGKRAASRSRKKVQ